MKYLAMFFTLTFMVIAGAHAWQDGSEDATGAEVSATDDNVVDAEAEEAAEPSAMDQPLDGTSIESFTAGLEKLDGEVSEAEYRQLMSALDYLLFYDIGARRDKARLYSRLNGKTPNQIMERVANNRKK